MKKALSFLLVLVFLFLPVSCTDNPADEKGGTPASGVSAKRADVPDTDLEFWITEDVHDFDFSGYTPKYGIMGGREYYGTGYVPVTGSDGQPQSPAACVFYTVTRYPDYASPTDHITRITVTDPAVRVYGLTLRSPAEKITETMRKNGYTPSPPDGSVNDLTFRKDDVRIIFCETEIYIIADITNNEGIIF